MHSFLIRPNGSFDLIGRGVSFLSCYPGINGTGIRPVAVALDDSSDEEGRIAYSLGSGKLLLVIKRTRLGFALQTTCTGLPTLPGWMSPLSDAQIDGATHMHRMGIGCGGPSGYCALDQAPDCKTFFESYGMSALGSDQKCWAIFSTHDHSKYLHVNRVFPDPLTRSYYRMSVDIRTENIIDVAGNLPVVHIDFSDSLEDGLKAAADTIGKASKAKVQQKPAYHWCSWYYAYYQFDHAMLKSWLDGMRRMQPSISLNYIQIDAGYFTCAGDWLSFNERWPHGLKAAFDDIRAAGYKPGIWIGPYMAGSRSKIALEHPDWILRHHDTKPFNPWNWEWFNEYKIWGLQDEYYYVLDTSHPAAMEYLRSTFRQLRAWGADFFKTDFMHWGLVDSTTVKRYNPGKTSVEYMRDVLDMIQEEIGDAYWLGCLGPFWPMIGYVDAMRIAGDVGVSWKGGQGPTEMLREIPGVNHINGAFWQNDPDAMMIRDFHSHLSDSEVEALALMQAISGGAVYTSDPLHEIKNERQGLFRFVQPDGALHRASLPYLCRDRKDVVLVQKLTNNKWTILAFNPTEEERTFIHELQDLIGHTDAFVREWKQSDAAQVQRSITATLPMHGAKLYFVKKDPFNGGVIGNVWNWE